MSPLAPWHRGEDFIGGTGFPSYLIAAHRFATRHTPFYFFYKWIARGASGGWSRRRYPPYHRPPLLLNSPRRPPSLPRRSLHRLSCGTSAEGATHCGEPCTPRTRKTLRLMESGPWPRLRQYRG